MQEISLLPDARQRPVVLVAPLVGPHHKNSHGLGAGKLVGDVLEKMVIPTDDYIIFLKVSGRAKVDIADFPAAAVARDQLQYAVAELSTHDNQRVTKALNDGLQAALTGAKTPEQAMKDAQREADRLLRPYKK